MSTPLQKTGTFGGPEVSYHQTYSARDWLSILRTSYPTQNLQRKHRTDLLDDLKNAGDSRCNPGVGTDQRVQSLMFMMMMKKNITCIQLVRLFCTTNFVVCLFLQITNGHVSSIRIFFVPVTNFATYFFQRQHNVLF